ncbi:armadillo repeat containing 6 [Seminavis robusta]|uniref:Armadillo repeat containing 6 n=1 Tax=Seminavis robusta TaxID=568900 RepID=A0A9N8HKK2_9STRA|nr:armadillo repeat containing 6 [Seminavis robusta]|eukprot:Sro621_g176780.1 armadillo repeat containing 6 (1313) ;mRNA; r:26793-30731
MSTLLLRDDPNGDIEFNKDGTTLTKEQRAARAKRKGTCWRCNIKTHKVNVVGKRIPLTDPDVYEGHCIRCDPDDVPYDVCVEWEQNNPDKAGLARRTSLHPQRGAHRESIKQVPGLQHADSTTTNTPPASLRKRLEEGEKAYPEGHCLTCGTQTHERKKSRRTSFLKGAIKKKDKEDSVTLVPLTVDGAVCEGKCLRCHPLLKDSGNKASPEAESASGPQPKEAPATNEEEHDKSEQANETDEHAAPPQTSSNSSTNPRDQQQENTSKIAASEAFQPASQANREDEPQPPPGNQTESRPMNEQQPGRPTSNNSKQQQPPRRVPRDPDAPIFGETKSSSEEVGNDNEQELNGSRRDWDIQETDLDVPSGRNDPSPVAEITLGPALNKTDGQQHDNMVVATAVVLVPSSEEQQQAPLEVPITSVQTRSDDPPDDGGVDAGPNQAQWPLPWPLHRNEEEGDDIEDDDVFDEHDVHHHHEDDASRHSEVSSLHFSTAEGGPQRSFIRQRSATSFGFPEVVRDRSERDMENSMDNSSLQRSAEKLETASKTLSAVEGSMLSNMSDSQQPSTFNGSSHNMQNSRSAASSSNSLMAEMLQCGNLLAWMQDIVEEARNSAEFRAEMAEKGGIVAIISAMKTNKTDGDIQRQGCLALYMLAKDHGTAIAKQGGVYCLLSAIKHHGESDPQVQEFATGALVYVMVSDSYKAGVARKGGIGYILAGMRSNINYLAAERQSCAALLRLSSHRDGLEALTSPKSKSVQTIVETMKRHYDDLLLQQYACGTLKNISMKETTRSTVVKEGGVKSIVTAINHHISSELLQQQACWALFEISSSQNVAPDGAIGAAISAMEAHRQNSNIQQHCCGVLRNLSVTKQNIYAVSKMKGIPTVLDAMEIHLENAELQRSACGALKHLSMSSTNEAVIAKQGGIQGIIQVMKRHKHDGTVQREACGALRNLSVKDENKNLIAQHGGVVCVLVAMKLSTNDASLQQKALGTLFNLSSNAELRRSIQSYGGVIAVVAIMKHLPGDAKVQQCACGTLKNLAVSEELRKLIAENGGIPCILSAMKKHNDAQLQNYACGALKNLASNEDNRQQIVKQKGTIAVISAMKNHAGDASVQQEGCTMLLSLSKNSEIALAIGKQGGIHAILSGMRTHQKNSNVQSVACAALWGLSTSTANQAIIDKHLGIQLIIAGMKGWVTVASVQQKAMLALTNMAASEQYRTIISKHGGIPAAIGAMKGHVRDAHVQKYGCRFLVAMLQNIKYKPEVRNGASAVRVAMEYHPSNPDIKKYAHKVIAIISFDDETGVSSSTRYREITSVEC